MNNQLTPESIDYRSVYNDFQKSYLKGTTTGEDVGDAICRLAQCFADYNLKTIHSEITANTRAAEIEQGLDENTGKHITSAKAKIVSEATPEHAQFLLNKTHLENIDQFINALKYLQRGILNEYAHMGGT